MENTGSFILQQICDERPLTPPGEINQALDDLLDTLDKLMKNADDISPEKLTASLERIAGWLENADESQSSGSDAQEWTVSYLGVAGMGGNVQCEKGSQALYFNLNAQNRPYQCIWEDQAGGETGQEISICLEQNAAGAHWAIKSASVLKQITLPPLPEASLWGSEADFLQALTSLHLPSEVNEKKPVEDNEPDPVADEATIVVQKCAQCGSPLKPGKAYCGKCGTPVLSAASETRVCPYCGKNLSIKARFCGACGHAQD